jgi:hypothetical protein
VPPITLHPAERRALDTPGAAYNCFTFLNFTNPDPAAALLRISSEQVGFITTVGFMGIFFTLPLVTVCRCHRTLLVFAGVLNAAAPVLRYVAAANEDLLYVPQSMRYQAVLMSSFFQGNAFGIIGAWPAVLATEWPLRRRTFVTAIASLSNYVGGAIGTLSMPLIAGDASALLGVFRAQAWACLPLVLLISTWGWIPAVPVRLAGAAPLRLVDELRTCCCHMQQALTIVTLGLAVGLSLALQGGVQVVLLGVGFSSVEGGTANTLYQLSAAVVGLALGGRIRNARGLAPTLCVLHACAIASYTALAGLCAVVGAFGRFDAAPGLMLAAITMLGASLMGMLPFALQLAVEEVLVSEAVVSSAVYMVAMVVAASLVQAMASFHAMTSIALIGGLLGLEAFCFLQLRASGGRGCLGPCCDDTLPLLHTQ